MANKIRTKARVRILLEIALPTVWEGDCPLDQVYKQSKDSARNIIAQAIANSGRNIRLVGTPETEAILVEE